MNKDIEKAVTEARNCMKDSSYRHDYEDVAFWEGYIDGLKDAESILNEKEKS